MLSKKGKLLFKLTTLVSIVGCAVLLYFGYYFFKDRTKAFIFFNGYIILLTGIVIFMAHRFIKTYITD